MKRVLATLLLFTVCAAPAGAANENSPLATAPGVGERVPEFTAEALKFSGDKTEKTQVDSHKTKRITAYIFVGTTCPATGAYVDRLKQIEATYGPKGVDVVYIYPNVNDTSDAKLAFHKQHQFAGSMIDDQGGKLAHLFKAQRTSELFLADKKGVVVYHGAIDDSRDPNAVKQPYLATALDELLAGKPITTSASTVFA